MHRHEWDMVMESAYCIRCNAVLKQKDIIRRLNATEHLTTEHMKLIVGYVGGMEPLENYIRALEGKDA